MGASASDFHREVTAAIAAFPSAKLVQRVADGSVCLAHYHAILTTLFHQTYSSPYTFAKAAANCPWAHEGAKEYLLRHAEEERSHWRWVLDDLKATAYAGPDPRQQFPHPNCEAYISFNERIAEHMPIARLAIASVLEGIGAAFGSSYGRQLLQRLALKPGQATFFLSHGETDTVHSREIADVIGQSELTSQEWGWMVHAACVAGHFYRAMYDHEAFW
jgi:hypothetical protein